MAVVIGLPGLQHCGGGCDGVVISRHSGEQRYGEMSGGIVLANDA